MATLYIVGTPIGNLEDISLRALRILKEVDLIVCEDTRVTKKLLSHFEISKPTQSFHTHSHAPKLDSLLKLLEEGQSIAYVSDAGTPGVSDPGAELVAAVREKLPGVKIGAIPGPSALAALISLSGVELTQFTFLGFPPHKKGRETFFKAIAESTAERGIPCIFYEAPTRVQKALEQLEKFAPETKLVIGRELTKKFEEVIKGTVTEIQAFFVKNPEKLRGEFVVLVH